MKCRHCKSELRLNFLDLGSAPPSNAYISADGINAPEVFLPLRLLVCEQCWLVQTDDYAAHDSMFSADYAYFSSFSSTWLAHSERYAQEMTQRFGLKSNSMVCEVAANDGYLLQYFSRDGIPNYGVEPTASTAAAARTKGIFIVEEFFGVALAEKLLREDRAADLTVANNVLAHVPDINDFLSGFRILLKPHGVATFEFPHLMQLVEQNQFDTVYHEHFSYLSLSAIRTIFAANGLSVFDVAELPTHGGSLRVFAQRADTGTNAIASSVEALLLREQAAGMQESEYYKDFQAKAEKIKNDVVYFLIEASRAGKTVAGYGAAAKGNTLLNFGGVRPDLIPFVVDKNPAKQGRFLPGSHIPILSETELKARKPDYIMILPWNIRDEVSAQLSYARDWGAKFVVAVPSLQVF